MVVSPPEPRGGEALGVFVKEAVPGGVKTRLGRDIGMAAAARLYEAFARDVLETATSLLAVVPVVFHEPADAAEACRALLPRCGAARARLVPQVPGDLGGRLASAFSTLLGPAGPGAARAVVIGTDLPDLTASLVEEAFAALRSVDLVLGPAADGGYYLVGLNSPEPRLFESIAWSTPAVLSSTLARARDCGLATHLLEERRDVDDADDLRALWSRLGRTDVSSRAAAPRTRDACSKLFGNAGICSDTWPGDARKVNRKGC